MIQDFETIAKYHGVCTGT